MVEIVFVKRRAKEGELGLFVDTPIFDEEWSSLKIGEEIKAECTVPANLKYLKFFWALVGKVVDNSPDEFLDKEDCKERILLEARHYKAVYDNLRDKTEIKAKSIAGLSGDTWIRLLRRVTHVVITKFLPGMEENALKAEIEKMIGMDVFSQPPAKPAPKPRTKGGEEPKPSEVSPPKTDTPTVGPQNEAEYIAACRSWLPKQTDRFKALNYFEGDVHKEMRDRLKVSQGAYRMLHREVQEYFNAKGQGQ